MALSIGMVGTQPDIPFPKKTRNDFEEESPKLIPFSFEIKLPAAQRR